MSGMAASGEEGVDELTQQSKVVFSSTLTEPLAWANTRLMTGDAVEAVRAMKEGSRIELRTLGSVSLCRSLITTGLVDRLRVVVFPVVTGATGQDRIYDGYPDIRLDLIESRTFDGGLQLLEYVPTVLDGPAGRHGSDELSEATDRAATRLGDARGRCREHSSPGRARKAELARDDGWSRLSESNR
jgi:dihydrofolate reductase